MKQILAFSFFYMMCLGASANNKHITPKEGVFIFCSVTGTGTGTFTQQCNGYSNSISITSSETMELLDCSPSGILIGQIIANSVATIRAERLVIGLAGDMPPCDE